MQPFQMGQKKNPCTGDLGGFSNEVSGFVIYSVVSEIPTGWPTVTQLHPNGYAAAAGSDILYSLLYNS